MLFGEAHLGLPFENVLICFRPRKAVPRLRSARIALSRALSGGRARPHATFGLANWPSGGAIDNDSACLDAGLAIDDGHARPFRGKCRLPNASKAIRTDGNHVHAGSPVFIPRRMGAVAVAFPTIRFDQRIEPVAPAYWRECRGCSEFIEAPQPEQGTRMISILHHSPTRSRLRAIGHGMLRKLLCCNAGTYGSYYHYESN